MDNQNQNNQNNIPDQISIYPKLDDTGAYHVVNYPIYINEYNLYFNLFYHFNVNELIKVTENKTC